MNKINQIIRESIIQSHPNSFGKIGGIEASHLLEYIHSGYPKLVRGNSLAVNAGIFTKNDNDLRLWCELYLKSIKSVDYILEWCPEQGDRFILDSIWRGKEKCYSFEDIEPFFHKEEGWHYFLKNKNILVLSPFEKTIEKQTEKYSKIWQGAEVGNVKTIKTPYPAALTGESPRSFIYTLQELQEKISKEKFDFAVVGCGGYSLIILDYIKNMGKPAVHLGGATQLLFGIRGKRWDESFRKQKWYGNEYWTKPLEEETPINNKLVEDGCYW